eukprot:2946664-Rhodomonas_salina.1
MIAQHHSSIRYGSTGHGVADSREVAYQAHDLARDLLRTLHTRPPVAPYPRLTYTRALPHSLVATYRTPRSSIPQGSTALSRVGCRAVPAGCGGGTFGGLEQRDCASLPQSQHAFG